MRFVVLWSIGFVALALFAECDALSCVRCSFVENNVDDRNCEDRCEGELCFIVVNKFRNATIVAGCAPKPKPKEADLFAKNNLCYTEQQEDALTICGCMLSDLCNDPNMPASEYMKIDDPILKDVYKSAMKGEESRNDTILIHPKLTVEMDDAADASTTTADEDSDDSSNAVGEVEPVAVFSSGNDTQDSEAYSAEAENSRHNVTNDTEISVLPTDDEDVDDDNDGDNSTETQQTPSHPVSISERNDDEPFSMTNMTGVGDVQETELNGDDDGDEDQATDDDAEDETSAKPSHSVSTTQHAITAKGHKKPVPVASASIGDGANSGMLCIISLTAFLLSLAIFMN
uniref:Activin_recp domain-containing protein n=1 Tax=Steinernema glaseri TaxID=37863 RepID=A0A1I8A8B2_9BILA